MLMAVEAYLGGKAWEDEQRAKMLKEEEMKECYQIIIAYQEGYESIWKMPRCESNNACHG